MAPETFQTLNPYTGKILKEYVNLSPSKVESIVQEAFAAYLQGKSKSVAQKSEELQMLAKILRKRSAELGEMISLEMGKPLADSLSEIEKCAVTAEFFASNLERFLAAEEIKAHYPTAKIVKDSIGPILAIMPWNFPVWQAIRFAVPAVGIGNPILLKHSSLTAGTAALLAEIFDEVAKGLLFNLQISHEQAATLIGDKRVRAVTLTGSAKAGKEIGSVAGRNLKKSVLELGGSDAYVVFADSELQAAAAHCAKARMVNNGQSCVAAKRFLVEKTVKKEFLDLFQKELREFQWGDPLKQETKVGTLASKKFQKQLLDQCSELEKNGAKKVFDLAEEKKFDFSGPDAFFPARIYEVPNDLDMAFQEEFFGPVALVFEFKDEKEALALCNHSIYGLGGAVFSSDRLKAERFARGMEAGIIAINDQVKSDARLPFGGVKDSGYGRELSLYGFNEFCNIKSLGIS